MAKDRPGQGEDRKKSTDREVDAILEELRLKRGAAPHPQISVEEPAKEEEQALPFAPRGPLSVTLAPEEAQEEESDEADDPIYGLREKVKEAAAHAPAYKGSSMPRAPQHSAVSRVDPPAGEEAIYHLFDRSENPKKGERPAAPEAPAPVLKQKEPETAPADMPLKDDSVSLFDKIKAERKAALAAAVEQQEAQQAAREAGGNAPDPSAALSAGGETSPFTPEGDQGSFTDTAEFHIDLEAAREASRVMNIQEKLDEDFRSFFSETVAVSRTDIENAKKSKKQKAEKMARVVRKEVETEAEQEEVFTLGESAETIEDYNDPEDAPAVRTELKTLKASLLMRSVLCGIIALLLVYTGLAAGGPLPLPEFLQPAGSALFYLLWNGVLLLIAGIFSASVLIGGIVGLWSHPTGDTLTALSVVGALIQCIYYLFAGNFSSTSATLFAPVAALALLCNALGKLLMSDTVMKNFELVAQTFDGAAAYRLKDEDLVRELTEGLGESEPALLLSRPAGFVKGFLKHSFSERASDRTARVCAVIALVGALGSFALSFYMSKDLGNALSSLAAALVLGGAFSASFVGAVPARLTQSAAARVGAVVPGWSAVEELRGTNVVHLQDKDLFPAGCVALHGIKTFEKERIDLAILYAASICVEGSPTLREIFLTVIENKTDILYPVENLQYENGCGFVAWLENNRVLLGNREMMERHGVEIPSLDYEAKYTKNGQRQPVYLAVSGRLFGMFVVSYHPDEDMAATLYDLESRGIAVAVSGRDFCITSSLLSEVYDMPESYVKVLSADEQDQLIPYTSYQEECEGAMLHLGTFPSFMGGLRAALAGAAGERSAAAIQLAGTILAVVLSLLLAFTSGLARLSMLAVISYLAAWFILSVAIPLAKKY